MSEIDLIFKIELIQKQFEYFHLALNIIDGQDQVLDQTRPIPQQYAFYQQFKKTHSLNVINRTWQISYYATEDFYKEMIDWDVWWVFVLCVLFTGWIGMGLLMLTGRMMQTSYLVKLRTEELEQEIAERIHTEAELNESKTRLTLVIKGSNDAPWDWDLEKDKIYYSPQWWRMLGYEGDELTSNTDLKQALTHPDDRKASIGGLQKAIESGQEMFSVELRLKHKQGHYLPVLERCVLSRDQQGNVLRISGTHMDLTVLRQSQRIEELRSFMLECLSNNMTLEKALTAITLKLESLWPEKRCSILLLDSTEKYLRIGAAPSLPDFYNEAVDGLKIGLNRGCCGNTAATGQYTIARDITTDFRWEGFQELAMQAGLASCWSAPVKSLTGKILGTFAIYQPVQAVPNAHEIALMETASYYTGLAIERKRTEVELKLLAKVFEQSSEGFMITDANRYIVKVNPAFTNITGYPEEEVIGKKPNLLSSGQHDQEFFKDIWRVITKQDYWQGEIWNRRKNGEIYPELLNISAIRDEQGKVSEYIGVFADITQLKASEAKLEFLAHHDHLTSLPNRLRLFYRLEHGISEAERNSRKLALLMLDLDRFKDVNDSFGHLAGDHLLQQVADFLARQVREIDTVARLGGDEFAIVIENISRPEVVAQIAQKIIDGLKNPWILRDVGEVLIGTSVGISIYPDNGKTPEVLLQNADAALYKAKKDGRSRLAFYSDDLTESSRQRIILEARLRRALVNKELKVYYQPQVNVATGMIVGAEALVRWQDPFQGLLLPDTFIPIAEQTGLIQSIGEWVLSKTCRDGVSWLQEGLNPMTLCVNISQYQVKQGGLDELVSSVITATGYPSLTLELELTETALMSDEQSAITLLQQLRKLGVKLAVDDFGTGYSCLAYLKRLPLDTLKIDKSFIREIPESQEDMEIASAIISLGHVLGLKVLAEGVETEQQLNFLKERGCDSYQGFWHSHPMTGEDFKALVIKENIR